MENNDVLMLSLVASLTSIILLSLKLCFRSKCSDISVCFGLMKIKREVQLETELKIDPKNETKNTNQPQPNTLGQPSMYPSDSNLPPIPQSEEV